jgi:hypothetical protein
MPSIKAAAATDIFGIPFPDEDYVDLNVVAIAETEDVGILYFRVEQDGKYGWVKDDEDKGAVAWGPESTEPPGIAWEEVPPASFFEPETATTGILHGMGIVVFPGIAPYESELYYVMSRSLLVGNLHMSVASFSRKDNDPTVTLRLIRAGDEPTIECAAQSTNIADLWPIVAARIRALGGWCHTEWKSVPVYCFGASQMVRLRLSLLRGGIAPEANLGEDEWVERAIIGGVWHIFDPPVAREKLVAELSQPEVQVKATRV